MRRNSFLIEGAAGRSVRVVCAAALCALLLLSPSLASSSDDGSGATGAPHAVAADSLDLEDHGSYRGEYVFGMTKAVMRSTLTPAIKPLALIFTIPLDLVTLPFAVVGGFLR